MRKLSLVSVGSIMSLVLSVACSDGGGSAGSGSGGSGGGSSAGSGGGSGNGGSAGAAGGAGGTAGATTGPGQVTVKVEGLTGLQGKILLGFLYPVGGAPNASMAGLCVAINASPFSVTDTMKTRTPGANDPCMLETAAKIVDPGTYELLLGIYTGGSMTPEQCSKATVVVAGDKLVIPPAFGACN